MAHYIKKIINKKEALKLIENRYPLGLFWHREGDIYTGIDNESGNAWTEDFTNLKDCKDWLKGIRTLEEIRGGDTELKEIDENELG